MFNNLSIRNFSPTLFADTQYAILNTQYEQIMQNKANFKNDRKHISTFDTRSSDEFSRFSHPKNKPNSNPIYVKLGNLKYEILSEFCILCSVFCVLYSVFCILCSVFCVLCSVFCVLYGYILKRPAIYVKKIVRL